MVNLWSSDLLILTLCMFSFPDFNGWFISITNSVQENLLRNEYLCEITLSESLLSGSLLVCGPRVYFKGPLLAAFNIDYLGEQLKRNEERCTIDSIDCIFDNSSPLVVSTSKVERKRFAVYPNRAGPGTYLGTSARPYFQSLSMIFIISKLNDLPKYVSHSFSFRICLNKFSSITPLFSWSWLKLIIFNLCIKNNNVYIKDNSLF